MSVLAACAYGPSFSVDGSVSDGVSGSPRSEPHGDATPVPVDDGAPSGPGAHAVDASPATRDTGPSVDAAVLPGSDATISPDLDASPLVDAAPADASVGPTPYRAPRAGDLMLSEILFDPSGPDPDGEWFELANMSNETLELRGIELRDGAARKHVVASSVLVAPHGYAVFVRSPASSGVPASVIAYDYGVGLSSSSGILLANGSTGAIQVSLGGVLLSRAAYGTFSQSTPNGSSLQARPVGVGGVAVTLSNDAFCSSSSLTPGAASACP